MDAYEEHLPVQGETMKVVASNMQCREQGCGFQGEESPLPPPLPFFRFSPQVEERVKSLHSEC
jgi:hypothetical protein